MQCYQCGTMVRPGTTRCPKCGAILDGDEPQRGRAGGERSPYDAAPRGSSRGRNTPPPRRDDRDGTADRYDDPRGGGRRGSGAGSSPREHDPLTDPRAPGFLKVSSPSSRRDDRDDERRYRDNRDNQGRSGAGGRGRSSRDEGNGQWNDPQAGRGQRGSSRDNRDSRDPYGPYADPRGRGAPPAYPGRYDDAPSAEYSAEMSAEYSAEYGTPFSAEMSAEYSAEYPDPRGGYDPRRGRDWRDADPRNARDARSPRGYDERRGAPARPYEGYDRDRRDRRGPPMQEPPLESEWDLPAAPGGWNAPSAGWNSPPGRAYAGPASGPGAARQQPTKPKRGRAVILITLAAIALLAVVAGLLLGPSLLSRLKGGTVSTDNAPPFVTYTPGATPTPPASYKEFDSAHALYVLDYPQTWSESSSNTPTSGQYDYVDQFTRPTPQASIIVEQASVFNSITRQDIINAEVQGGSQPKNGLTFSQVTSPATTMEIGGEQWLRSDYLVTTKTGGKVHMAILACHHRQLGYALVLVSLPENFAQDSQTVFQTALNTFHFVG